MQKYPVSFDAEKIIGHFGGLRPTLATLEQCGFKVNYKTFVKQYERRRFTSDMIACLALAAHRSGKPMDINLYIREIGKDENRNRIS